MEEFLTRILYILSFSNCSFVSLNIKCWNIENLYVNFLKLIKKPFPFKFYIKIYLYLIRKSTTKVQYLIMTRMMKSGGAAVVWLIQQDRNEKLKTKENKNNTYSSGHEFKTRHLVTFVMIILTTLLYEITFSNFFCAPCDVKKKYRYLMLLFLTYCCFFCYIIVKTCFWSWPRI